MWHEQATQAAGKQGPGYLRCCTGLAVQMLLRQQVQAPGAAVPVVVPGLPVGCTGVVALLPEQALEPKQPRARMAQLRWAVRCAC